VARLLAVSLVVLALPLVPVASAGGSTAPPKHPFGRLVCAPAYGVTFCTGGLHDGVDRRIPSFDGVPLDADLMLPATGKPPYPLLVILHGLGGNKFSSETTTDDGGLDNRTFAGRGWAVLTYSARGFGDSCGTATSRASTPACAKGWFHFADQRYEVRDTQYLAGLLVDEGYARPAIAAAGVSYGGGQTLELAMLKNRMERPDGSFVPFVSPRRHIPMSIAAAFAVWPWDDLATALVPNGRLSQRAATPASADRTPAGVVKTTWNSILYGSTETNGYLSPAGADPQADWTTWTEAFDNGEPFGPEVSNALFDLQRYKSALGIPMPSNGPAPTLIESGLGDSLFPVNEALHYALAVRAAGDATTLVLVFDDVGHSWAQAKPADVAFNGAIGIRFLNAVVLGRGTQPSGVLVRAMTCPVTAPSGPTVRAPTWAALQTSSVRLTGMAVQVVTSGGGNRSVAAALDAQTQPFCDPLPSAPEPGTATYSVRAGSSPLHVLGGVQISARLSVTGNYPELVGRLWDVAPDGTTRQIVEMGAFRPSVNQVPGTPATAHGVESVSFELPPNDFVVARGHSLQLELVGSTAPFFRPSNGTFTISVSHLRATVPLGSNSS